jgi:hypothetical protein
MIFVEVISGDKRKRYRIDKPVPRIDVSRVVYHPATTWDNLDDMMRGQFDAEPVEQGSLYIFEVQE